MENKYKNSSSIIDKSYYNEFKKLKILSDTELLADILFLNYAYSNKEYNNETGESVYKSMKEKIVYSDKEKKVIIHNAIELLKIKHNINFENFNELLFKKED